METQRIITEDQFKNIKDEYVAKFPVSLGYVDVYGQAVYGNLPNLDINFQDACRFAVQESLRWGGSSMSLFEDRYLLWGIPVMCNEKHYGGLVGCNKDPISDEMELEYQAKQLRAACVELRLLAEKHNVTNTSALTLKRSQYESERERAYAIQDVKQNSHASVMELYLREEPALFSAIKSGNRGKARHILNTILVAIHHYAGDSVPLIKGFFMELVAGMFRTAVDAGGKPEELLGNNYMTMVKLSEAETETELANWLRETLERLMTVIQQSYEDRTDTRLLKAMDYMKKNCCSLPTREEVAEAAGMSESNFSTLIKKHTNATFTQMLNQMRTDYAAVLLRNTSKPLSTIAIQTGFNDQSYFTKIFKQYQGKTPRQYTVAHKTDHRG